MPTSVPAVLLALLPSLLSTQVAKSPPPPQKIEGSYVVSNRDGTPPIPGSTVRVTILPNLALPGSYLGLVTRNGEPMVGENQIIFGSGANYVWLNERDTPGTYVVQNNGDVHSTVTGGGHAGTERILVRQ